MSSIYVVIADITDTSIGCMHANGIMEDLETGKEFVFPPVGTKLIEERGIIKYKEFSLCEVNSGIERYCLKQL